MTLAEPDRVRRRRRRVAAIAIASDDVAVLQYTGGTTGTPKGAMLTHGNIFANVVQTEAFMYRTTTRGDARYLLVIPYFHIYAFTVGMMMGVWVGALQILIPKYDVEQVLAAIRDFRPTYFPAVPTVFVSLLEPSARRRSTASRGCAPSTAAARRARLKSSSDGSGPSAGR